MQFLAGAAFYIAGLISMISAHMNDKPAIEGLLLWIIGTLWFATAPVEGK